MSLQWLLVAAILHIQVITITLLTVQWIPLSTWQRVLHGKWTLVLNATTKKYKSLAIGVMGLLLIDSMREVAKFSSDEEDMLKMRNFVRLYLPSTFGASSDYEANAKDAITSESLFRAQRDFYTLALILLFSFVIRRMVHLILRESAKPNNKTAPSPRVVPNNPIKS